MEATPNEVKSTTTSSNQHHKHGVSSNSLVIATADLSGVEDKNQPNFLRKLGMLNQLGKEFKIRKTTDEAG